MLCKKWMKKILYELEGGEKNFSTLMRKLNISSRSLSNSLKELVNLGLISRSVREDRTTIYSLTRKGKKIALLIHRLEKILGS